MFGKSIAAAIGATMDEVLQPERVRTDNLDEWWKPTCGAFFEKQTEMKNTKEVKIGDTVTFTPTGQKVKILDIFTRDGVKLLEF